MARIISVLFILLFHSLVVYGLRDTLVCGSGNDSCVRGFGGGTGLKPHPYDFMTIYDIVARVIKPTANQTGAVWYQSQNLDPRTCFDVTVSVFFSDPDRRGVEGAACILGTVNNIVGMGGSQLGIPQGASSLAIVIDTHYNPSIDCLTQEPDLDYISIIQNGDFNNVLYGPVPIDDVFEMRGGGAFLEMRIYYDATLNLLQVLVNNYLQINLKINLQDILQNANALLPGFSAASDGTNTSTIVTGLKSPDNIRLPGFCNPSTRNCGFDYNENYLNWLQLDTRSKAQWVFTGSELQQINPANNSSFILSPNEIIGMHIQFRIVTKPNSSGGLVGIVIGAKTDFESNPLLCSQNPPQNHYNLSLLSWKPPNTNPALVCGQEAPPGYFFSSINAEIDPGCGIGQENQFFWQRSPNSRLNPPVPDSSIFDVQIQYTAKRLLIIINAVTIVDIEGTFQAGRIGLFCHKQVALFSKMTINHPPILSIDNEEVCTNALGEIKLNLNQIRPDEILELKIGSGKPETFTKTSMIPSIIPYRYAQTGNVLIQLTRKLPSISNDCEFSERINVRVADTPLVTPKIKTDTTICHNAVILFTIQDYNKSYEWQDHSRSPSYLVNKPGIYTVRALDHPCQAILKVNYAPPLSLTIQRKAECEDQSLSEASYITTGGVPPYHYFLEGNLQDGSIIKGLSAGKYRAEVRDNLGCAQTLDFEVEEIRRPNPIVQLRHPTCYGGQDGQISLSSIPENYRLLFNGSSVKNNIIGRLSSGIYYLNWQDTGGYCTFKDTFELIQPAPLVTLPDVLEIPLGQSLQLSPSFAASKNLQMEWQASPTLTCTSCPYPIAKPKQDTRYQVKVRESLTGCEHTASVLVKVIDKYKLYVPNAFSPNGDGNNDYWYPQTNYHTKAIQKIYCRINSPWGSRVFDKELVPNEPLEGWDGRFNGEFVNGGPFLYTIDIEYIDGHKEHRIDLLNVIR